MARAKEPRRTEMKAPIGPPPTDGLAYAGDEAEMPAGQMEISGSMGDIDQSPMSEAPRGGMTDAMASDASGAYGGLAQSPGIGGSSEMPGAAELILAAGMIPSTIGMAIAGMGMDMSSPDAFTSTNGMPAGSMEQGTEMPAPSTGGAEDGTGQPTAGGMPGEGTTAVAGSGSDQMPGTSAPAVGTASAQTVQLSGTWQLTLTIGAVGGSAAAPS